MGHVLFHDLTGKKASVFKGELFKRGHVIQKEDIEKLGASNRAKLWIEAKEGYVFDADARDFIVSRDQVAGPRGNHGFLPTKEKNMAIGIFRGPDFKANKIIENGKIVDIAPTIDKIYNLEMKNMTGSIIEDSLK